MIGVKPQDSSLSLKKQVAGLEARLMSRRERVRALLTGANHQAAVRMTTPGMLLAAMGVGFAVEQVGHRQHWSLAAILEAGHSCAGLLLTFASFGQQAGKSKQQPCP